MANVGKDDAIETPSEHLWTLLNGTTVLASYDVVHEELTENCNKLITGLVSYKKLTSDEVESYVKTQSATPTAKEKLKLALVKHLKLSENDAYSLFLSYIMYEHKGSAVNYEKLVESEKELTSFLGSLDRFYKNERLCLIYCTQLLLRNAVNEKHPYTEIFSAFVQSASMEDWVKWMILSLDQTLNNEERSETLHAICVILFYMSRRHKVVVSAVNQLENYDWSLKGKSDDVLQAEAILCYTLLQCGDITNQDHNKALEKYLEQNVQHWVTNSYTLFAVLQCFKVRCPESKTVRESLQTVTKPLKSVLAVSKLIDSYNVNSYKNNHGIAHVAIPVLSDALKFVLGNYMREHFGSTEDWYTVVESLLQDPETADDFIHDSAEEYLQIYFESIMTFPVYIETMLKFWKAIFSSVTLSSLITPETLCQSIEELKWIAEVFDKIDPRLIRPNGNNEWILLQDRTVCNTVVKAGSVGVTLEDRHPLVICWPVRPGQDIRIWRILLHEFLRPCVEDANRGDNYSLDHNESQLIALAEFLIAYSKVVQEISGDMLSLFKPLIYLLRRQASEKTQGEVKSRLFGTILLLTAVEAKFEPSILTSDVDDLYPLTPEPNEVMKIIIGYESVTTSKYSVTKSFLKSLLLLLEIPTKDGGRRLQEIREKSIWFIVESILPAYEHWRNIQGSAKNVIVSDCLRILLKIFKTSGDFLELKQACSLALMSKSSSLFTMLRTGSVVLEDSIVRPKADTALLPEIMIQTISLLMEVYTFNKNILKTMDSRLALALIQKLGLLCRHRLNSKIPTLAIQFLKNIAAESSVSVLACLNTDAESFRDLILSRLELKSEDIHMKVGILEFLSVCAHTQLGLVQHFFEEENFVDRLLELFQEKEEQLSIAVLGFIRALFRRGTSLIKSYKGNVWEHIFDPLLRLKSDSGLEVVIRTMNIATFEIFTNSGNDGAFIAQIDSVLRAEKLKSILNICFTSRKPEALKAALAVKQFIVVLLSRPDCQISVSTSTKLMVVELLVDTLVNLEEDLKPGGIIAEFLLHLRPWDDPEFFDGFVTKLAPKFDKFDVATRKPLLALIVHSIRKATRTIEPSTIGHVTRIVSSMFFKSAQVYDSDQAEMVHPVLALSANAVTSIIKSPHCLEWRPVFHSSFLIMAVVNVASVGLMKGKGPEIVAECLGVLTQLCTPETCNALTYKSFGKYLWLPMAKYAVNDQPDFKWREVYLLGVHLNARMTRNLKYHYMEDCLNFWGLHGLHLTHKLWDIAEVVDRFYLKTPEKNFREMKELLEIILFTLDSVAAMCPFVQKWRLEQPQRLTQLLEGVFTALRTSVALLSQPNHLLFLLSTSKNGGPQEVRLTPQLLEIQTKLWEVMVLGIDIVWNLRNHAHEYDFIEPGVFMTTIYSAIDLCVKGLTKGDKRQTSVNVKGLVSVAMEKSLGIVFFRGRELLDAIQHNHKDEMKALKREFEAETFAVCDNVKRLGLGGNEFLTTILASLEEMFK